MNKQLSNNIWRGIQYCMILYSVLIMKQYIQYFFPEFHNNYLFIPYIHNILMAIGTIIFFLFLILLFFNVIHVIRIKKKLSLSMLLLLFSNLLLIYLEIIKQGDS